MLHVHVRQYWWWCSCDLRSATEQIWWVKGQTDEDRWLFIALLVLKRWTKRKLSQRLMFLQHDSADCAAFTASSFLCRFRLWCVHCLLVSLLKVQTVRRSQSPRFSVKHSDCDAFTVSSFLCRFRPWCVHCLLVSLLNWRPAAAACAFDDSWSFYIFIF